MKRTLKILALLVALAAVVTWAATGANRGWTKTEVAVKTLDPVTEIEGISYQKKFQPGVDFLGAAFGGDNGFATTDPTLTGSNRDAAFLGGGQIGADYQFAPNWLVGVEANISGVAGNAESWTNGAFIATRRNDYLGSVTGRLGYTWGPTLLYAKGGYAWADTRFTNGFGGDGGRDGYIVKRMPNTGRLHAPDCPSYEPPAEFSGLLGTVSAIAEALRSNGESDEVRPRGGLPVPVENERIDVAPPDAGGGR